MEEPLDLPDPPRAPCGRAWEVWGAAVLLTLTGLYACWCRAPLIWDGAPQFCWTLLHQIPYAYGGWLGRFHSRLLWIPVTAGSGMTSDADILQAVFGLPFVLAPVAGLLLSWWVVKREAPELVLWALFGIAAAPLPGQIFVINDSIFQQHLFWPVFMGALVPLTRGRRVLLTLLAFLQLSHPIGLVLVAGAAGAAAVLGLLEPAIRRRQFIRAGLLLGLAALIPLKLRLLQDDPQASAEMTWLEVVKRWYMGVEGAPLMGLTLMWLAAALTFTHGRVAARADGPWRGRLTSVGALASAVAGGVVWAAWASDAHAWRLALDYRRWLVPLTFPFFLLALCDAYRCASFRAAVGTPAGPSPSLRLRAAITLILAGVYTAVLATQCTVWRSMLGRLMHDVNSYPAALVPRSAVPWVEGTALNHWSLPSVVTAMQGVRQEKVLLFEPEWEESLRQPEPRVALTEWERWPIAPGPGGWFDFRPFFENYQRTAPPPARAPP